jgi:hypothetical protein
VDYCEGYTYLFKQMCVDVMFIHRNQILVLPTYAGNVPSLPLVVIIGYGKPGKGMMQETKVHIWL